MPNLRPGIEGEQVLALLQQHYTEPIINLASLEGGQVARTFAFRVSEQDYILRFMVADSMPISFAKEPFSRRRSRHRKFRFHQYCRRGDGRICTLPFRAGFRAKW